MEIDQLLRLAMGKRASDLHLRVGSCPVLRIDDKLTPQNDLPQITNHEAERLFEQITTQEQRDAFSRDKELDFAYTLEGVARFRVSVLWQRKTISIACRMVPLQVPTIDELELPEICKELILQPKGLILVTGPTGVGKSTTMAAMIRHLNENRECNVISIEDPIEYQHPHVKSLIAQRELGDDTRSFSSALVHSLRHDPDVIVIGEMRDLDTIATAITAAETGHLVMSTLHTFDAPQTLDRMIDVFPPYQQTQIRLQLSQAILAILSQILVPRAEGKGRIAAFEIVIANPAIRTLIRESRTYEIPSYMQLGDNRSNMQTMDQALASLVKKGKITREEATIRSSDPERLERLLRTL
ncbi:MAG: type IV pilus twitching motility protein PilT [Chloroflexi bacterium]|nr:type IV pilus twitching motility protein PilT [Chloroflexota bacterium]